MNFKRLNFILIISGAILTSVWAAELPPPTTSTVEKKFTYRPTDNSFWQNIEQLWKEGDFAHAATLGAEQTKRYGVNTIDGREGNLATAMSLVRLGLNFGPMQMLMELATSGAGTSVGEAALEQLATLSTQDPSKFDRDTLHAFINSNEFGVLHPDIQSFVSMHRYLYNLRFGFQRWAEMQKKLIVPSSPWDFELRYWAAIGDVARDKISQAEVSLKDLETSAQAPSYLKTWAKAQLARLAFEQGQFAPAQKLYSQIVDLGVREQGRFMLETAWTHYYLKQYDSSLGLLQALRAPYFNSSLTPERFILEILIYRDLCHYEAVQQAVQNFKSSFQNSFRAIRKRQPLREEPVLLNMTLLNRDLQTKANLIDQLRREREQLGQYKWQGFAFYKPMMIEYSRRDRMLQRELDIQLEPRVRVAAEALLDYEEQLQFLDYTSKLDALRLVREGEDRNFSTPPISYLTFESIFWPVQKEFWWDELKDYRVLISSRCQQDKSPTDEKMEREFK